MYFFAPTHAGGRRCAYCLEYIFCVYDYASSYCKQSCHCLLPSSSRLLLIGIPGPRIQIAQGYLLAAYYISWLWSSKEILLLHAFLVRVSGSPSNNTIGHSILINALKKNWYDFVQYLSDMTVALWYKACNQGITEV